MPTPRTLPQLIVLVVALAAAGCAGRAASSQADAPPSPPVRPLSLLAAQRIVVAPVHSVAEGDPLGWAAGIPRQRDWMRELDGAIGVELGARGLGNTWVHTETLARAYERNPTLSPDPYRLAAEPLQRLTRVSEERLPDPLASQLRTLVAVHDARFVLLPVRVSFERAGEAGGRAVMRLALLDARAAEVRWLGDVRSDGFSTFNPEVAVSLAARLADLIAAP